jgi:GT2 family glycosyltransferase
MIDYSMNKAASIIILNYNGKHFLKNCLNSVLRQSYRDYEIIFFDNNSSDGSVEYVKENFKNENIRIIEAVKNLGFAGGCNEAIKYTANDLIILLNNDTETDKDWLKYLLEAVKENNTVASSFVITEGINPEYYKTNGSVSYLMYNIMNIFGNIEDEFYPNGCSVIFRKSEIPVPFDPEYFYYSEDLYLGLKARFMGMKIKFAKNSIVHHFGGGSAAPHKRKTFYQERNRLLNLYTFFSFWFLVRILPIICLVQTAKLIQSTFSKKQSFFGLFNVFLWFCFNLPAVFKKRKHVKNVKKVSETEVLRYMTSKLVNHESAIKKFVNNLSYFYSRMIGIKPIEYYQKKRF